MSHHYDILANTLNIFAPLSFCCILLANPKHEWNCLLAFTMLWYQSSWALPEKVNKADGLSHSMFLTTDFNEVSMLLDNPPVSLVGMPSLQLFTYFNHILLLSSHELLSLPSLQQLIAEDFVYWYEGVIPVLHSWKSMQNLWLPPKFNY